jgi:hypothetical protein
MPTNDFLPFGFSEDANVMSQAEYLTLTARNKGFSAGTAKSEQLNKAWRQSSLMAVTLAQFIVDKSGQSAVDDGTTAALQAHLLTAIQAASRQTTIIADTGVANAYAALNNPALTALPVTGYSQRVNIANANTGPSTYAPDGLAAKPVYGLALQPLQGGELPVGVAVMMYLVQPGVNGGNGAWVIIESLGAAAQVANATKSRHAVAAGQIQSQALTAFPSSGTSPALTLTPIPAISAYAVNQRFCVTFNAASTGADTLNVSGLGAKGIKQYDATGVKVAAMFAAGQTGDVVYDGTDVVLLDPLPGTKLFPMGFMTGLQAAVVSSEVISVSPGGARDTTDHFDLSLPATLNAGLYASGVWAAGTGGHKLDTGVRASGTWYHLFLIRKVADGSCELLFSLSLNAPLLPSGYSGFCRIGSFRTDASGLITPFIMDIFNGDGRRFRWVTPIREAIDANITTTASTLLLTVPNGFQVEAEMSIWLYTNNILAYFSPLDTADLAMTVASATGTFTGYTAGYGSVTGDAIDSFGFKLEVRTDKNAQIRARANVAGKYSMLTLGWWE